MDKKPPATTDQTNRIYEDFDPSISWARQAAFDTLTVHLPGFTKEQLKVQVTASRKLKITGERPLRNNKWSRFYKEIPIPSNYNTKEITAKFENSKLHVTHPKLISPAEPEPQPKPPTSTQQPKPQIPDSQAQNTRQEQAAQGLPSNTAATEKQKSANGASQKHKQDLQTLMTSSAQELASQQVPPKTNMDKKEPSFREEKSGASGPDDAKTVSRKSTLENKNGGGKNIPNDAKTVSRKSTIENKNEELGHGGGENITDDATMEEKKDVGGVTASNDDGKRGEEEAAETSYGREKSRVVEDFKQALGFLIWEMKHSRKLMNLVVALLVVLVAVHYARNVIKSTVKSDD